MEDSSYKEAPTKVWPEADISNIHFHDVISMKPVRKNTRSAPEPTDIIENIRRPTDIIKNIRR